VQSSGSQSSLAYGGLPTDDSFFVAEEDGGAEDALNDLVI